MCGIVGIYAKRGALEPEVVREMAAVLVHRGPMDEGYMVKESIGLGIRRLSIIDIAGGHQPIYNEDRSVAVILNGEIFNYRELRQQLTERGHRFSTASDTEVIAHLYEDFGEKCLSELNGMFAIALWDERKQRLFLARDRLGVKPLYYWEDSERVAFASELKALLLCDFVPRRVDRRALLDYLAFMYIRAPRSPFEGVRKLLPGHYLTADASGVHTVRYWSLRDYCQPLALSEDDVVDRLRWLIQDAVRIRLRSDVPVGAFLSGGIDSSTIVAYAAKLSGDPLKTFTVDFGGDSFDEARYARLVAESFGTEHHETAVTVDDALEHLPKLVWHLDEPNADSAVVPTYLVSQFAATKLRVILSGLGGDEIFGGYSRYFDGWPVEHLYRRIPQRPRELLGRASSRFAPSSIARRIVWNNLPDEERYLVQLSNFSAEERQQLLGDGVRWDADLRQEFAAYPGRDQINRRMFVDAHTYLPDDILHITDRMSMAVSLEARTPFLDYRLVEFSAGLPGQQKVRRDTREWKILLKKATMQILPRPILTRVKWGFGAPVQAWMNNGLLAVVQALYRTSHAVRYGLLDANGVQRTLLGAGSRVRTVRTAQQLWTLLILEIWCRVFLGANGKEASRLALRDLLR